MLSSPDSSRPVTNLSKPSFLILKCPCTHRTAVTEGCAPCKPLARWRAHKEQLLPCDTDRLGSIRPDSTSNIFRKPPHSTHGKESKTKPRSEEPRSQEPPGTQAWRTCGAPCTGMCTLGERTGLPCLSSKLGSRICGQQAMARGCRCASQEWPSVPLNLSISRIHTAVEMGWEEQRQSQVQPRGCSSG